MQNVWSSLKYVLSLTFEQQGCRIYVQNVNEYHVLKK